MWDQLLINIRQGDIKSLARCISLVENEVPGYDVFLESLPFSSKTNIIGLTGPPGAGKSTLADALISEIISHGQTVAVLCVDPSSPFNLGALLGDRIRMSEWYKHPGVFIRSLATRGALGGLHPRIIEISEILKASPFDYIIIETVGVGQSEIEISGLADSTVVVLVPEAGDEVQTMKAGLMEIADIFVVNKADRPDADLFVKNLRTMLAPAFGTHKLPIDIVKTVATNRQGIAELWSSIETTLKHVNNAERKNWLLAEKAYYLIRQNRMKDISRAQLQEAILSETQANLYQLVKKFS